jgi:hypothetical protein
LDQNVVSAIGYSLNAFVPCDLINGFPISEAVTTSAAKHT